MSQDEQDARDFRTIQTRGLYVEPPIEGDKVWRLLDRRTNERFEGRTLPAAVSAARKGERA